MGDSLYLSLWFPSFDEAEILPRTVSVLRQLPFSATRDGVGYAAIQPVSWSEPTILERRFLPGVPPEDAAEAVAELIDAANANGGHDNITVLLLACP